MRPPSPPRLAALPIQTPLSAEWPDVRLLGYTLPGGAWRTGDALHAELFWQARTATDPNVVTTLVVQDANGQTLARSDWNQWPRQEPMQPGDLRREQREVVIPASLSAGTYRLALARARAGDDGREQVALSTIVVVTRPHQFSAPPVAVPQDFRLGDVARLVGSDWTLDAKARTLRLRLSWRALNETQESYRVFVHVTRLDSPQPLAHHDGLPANGEQPTTTWVKGEYITDEHTLTLPPDIAPGAYRVLVGLYLPRTGQRLPAYASDGHQAADDALEVASFTLAAP